MRDCWKTLNIKITTDQKEIKKAFRELIKKHHPDKFHTPEEKRKNTIKSTNIIDAYNEAIKYASNHTADEPILQSSYRDRSQDHISTLLTSNKRYAVFHKTWTIFKKVSGWIIILFIVIDNWFSLGLLDKLFHYGFSLNPSKPAGIIFRAIMTITAGSSISVFAGMAIFLLFIFVVSYLTSLLDKVFKTDLMEHSYKISFVIVLSIILFMFSGNHFILISYETTWEQHLFNIAACFAFPVMLIFGWLRDYLKYYKIKDKYHKEKETIETAIAVQEH